MFFSLFYVFKRRNANNILNNTFFYFFLLLILLLLASLCQEFPFRWKLFYKKDLAKVSVMSRKLKTTKKYSKYNIKFKSYNIIYEIKNTHNFTITLTL